MRQSSSEGKQHLVFEFQEASGAPSLEALQRIEGLRGVLAPAFKNVGQIGKLL